MAGHSVFVRSYPAPVENRREVMRYAKAPQADAPLLALLEECCKEAAPVLKYQLCFTTCGITVDDHRVDLGFRRIESRSLSRHLSGCDRAVIFGATLGIGLDRLITRYGVIRPSKALLLESYGNERIEALCDVFCEELAASLSPGEQLCSRFSPGYGDLSLDFQQDIITLLGCPVRIGLSLTSALLMTPSKSVTALVGIRKTDN